MVMAMATMPVEFSLMLVLVLLEIQQLTDMVVLMLMVMECQMTMMHSLMTLHVHKILMVTALMTSKMIAALPLEIQQRIGWPVLILTVMDIQMLQLQ